MNKKLLKNFCAVFLAGFMALLLLAQSAQAQEKEAYVVISSDQKTLTFYYDDQKSSRTGTVLGIETGMEDFGNTLPAWSGMGGYVRVQSYYRCLRCFVQELSSPKH